MHNTRPVRAKSIFLALIGTCLVLAIVATAPVAAAQTTGDANVTAQNPANYSATVHDWELTNETAVSGIDEIHVNYTTDTSVNNIADITIDTNSWSAAGNTTYSSNNTIEISLSGSNKGLGSNEQLNLSVAGVRANESGESEPTIGLYNTTNGEYRANATANLTIYDSFHVDGTLYNRSTGNKISGDSVDVVFENTTSVKNIDVQKTNVSNGAAFAANLPVQAADSETIKYRVSYLSDSYVNKTITFEAPDSGPYSLSNALQPGGTISGTLNNTDGTKLTTAANESFVHVFNKAKGYQQTAKVKAGGSYSIDVPEGTYNVSAEADSHGAKIRSKGVAVTQASTRSNTNLTLDPDSANYGTVSGTISGPDGAIDGTATEITVVGFNVSAGGVVATDRIDSSGDYSLDLSPGRYAVGAFDTSGTNTYKRNITFPVDVATTTTTEDLKLSKASQSGTITATIEDSDGNPIEDADVRIQDQEQANINTQQTDSNGKVTFNDIPPGTYDIGADKAGYGRVLKESELSVTEGDTASTTVQLAQAATLSGTLSEKNGRAFVIAQRQSDDRRFFERVNSSNGYKMELAPGDYRVTVFGEEDFAPSKKLTGVEAGDTESIDFTTLQPDIKSSSVTVTDDGGGNVDTSDIGVKAQLDFGFLKANLYNKSAGGGFEERLGLGGENVTDQTRFQINMSVEDYKPDSLLWAAKDVNWEATTNESGPGYNVTVNLNATSLFGTQAEGARVGPILTQDTDNVDWPSGAADNADLGWNQTVQFGLFNLSTLPPNIRDNLAGMTVTTNAQTFGLPKFSGQSLRIWVAGPSTTVNGNENTGFYRAFIPDSQLDEWDVDDPKDELLTRYRGSSIDASVDTSPDDGVWIKISGYSYSAGEIEIEADPQTDDDDNDNDDTTDSGGGGGPIETEEEEGQTDEDIAQVKEQIEQTEPDTETEIEITDTDPDTEGIEVETGEETETISGITLNEEIDGSIEVQEYTEPPEEVEQEIEESVAEDIAADVSEEVTEDVEEDVSEEVESDTEEEGTTGDETEDTTDDSGGGTSVDVVTVADISPSSDSDDDAADTSATVTMSVDRESVDDPNNAVIVHETDQGWEELETNVESTSEEEVTLSALTESFSLFAVAEVESEDGTVTQTNQTADDASDESSDDSDQSEGFIPGFGVPVAVVAVIAMAMVARRRQS